MNLERKTKHEDNSGGTLSVDIPIECTQCPTGGLQPTKNGGVHCPDCGTTWPLDLTNPRGFGVSLGSDAESTTIETEAESEKPAIRALSASEFLQTEFPPRENILSPWLPTQGLSLIHSVRGVGKTHCSLGIAYAVASGGEFLRWTAEKPRGVLFVDGEMPGVALQERLSRLAVSSPLEPIAPLNIITPDLQAGAMPNLATRTGQGNMEGHLDGVELLILDNISTLCRGINENDADAWLIVQEWGLHLRKSGLTVLFIHHSGKDKKQRGTSRREDVLDTVINLKHAGDYHPNEGAKFEVNFEKSRGIYGDDVKPFEAALTNTPDGGQTWAVKDLEDSRTEKIARLLNDGIPQNEIAEMLGVVKGTVSKHKKKAQHLGLLNKG